MMTERPSDLVRDVLPGQETPEEVRKPRPGLLDIEEDQRADKVKEALMDVIDPELMVNIVDLGLVYDCQLNEEEDGTVVSVKMTLTAPGCGMGPTIAADAQSRIMTIDSIKEAQVELVWDPPWTQDMISEEGKMKLGLI